MTNELIHLLLVQGPDNGPAEEERDPRQPAEGGEGGDREGGRDRGRGGGGDGRISQNKLV